jgi:ribosomal protein S27AE
MEFIRSKCKKCGYEIIMPEKSESIICGSCGTINHFSKISSILKKYNDSLEPVIYKETSDELLKSPGERVPAGWKTPEVANLPSGEDEEEAVSPEAKRISKIMTFLFILAPFIALAIDYFKLPSYTALIIIVFIIGIIYFLRR